jgi:excisionase family DNA binding protein
MNSDSKDEISEKTLWTVDSVAHYLHVSPKTVFNLRKKGLPYIQLGGAVRFDPQRIKEYLSQNQNLARHRGRRIADKRYRSGQ